MKELCEYPAGLKRLAIGISEDNNYVLYDKNKGRKGKKTEETSYTYKYYSSLEGAVKEVCRLAADEKSHDLHSWLVEFRQASGDILGAFLP